MSFPVSPGDGDPSILASSSSGSFSGSEDSFAQSYQGSYLESGHSASTGTMSSYSQDNLSRDDSLSSIQSFSASSTAIAEDSPSSFRKERLSGRRVDQTGNNSSDVAESRISNVSPRKRPPPRPPSSRSSHSHSNSHSMSSRSSYTHSGSSGGSSYQGSLQSFLSKASALSAQLSQHSSSNPGSHAPPSQQSYSSQPSSQLSRSTGDCHSLSYRQPSQHSYSQNDDAGSSAEHVCLEEPSQHSFTNSQASGSVESLRSCDSEQSHQSLTNSQHSGLSNDLHSHGTVESNANGSNQQSQHSYSSNDQQLSLSSFNSHSIASNDTERSQQSVLSNSQSAGCADGGPSLGSVESYQEPSHHSASCSQEYDSANEKLSQGSISDDSLGSNDREPSQRSVSHSQNSGMSNSHSLGSSCSFSDSHRSCESHPQVSQSRVQQHALASSNPEQLHPSISSGHYSEVHRNQVSRSDNSLSSTDQNPSHHSLSNSQNSYVPHEQLPRGFSQDDSIGSTGGVLSQHSLTNSQSSGASPDGLSQGSIEDKTRGPNDQNPSQHSASNNDHSDVSSMKFEQDSSEDNYSMPSSDNLQSHLSHPSGVSAVQCSKGSIEDSSFGSSDQESSQHSGSKSQHSAAFAAQLSEGSIEDNSLGSSDHLSSQHSLANSQKSCASSDQLSRGPVEDNALDSCDQNFSQHSASSSRQLPSPSADQLSESSIGGNSLGSSDNLSSQHSVANSQDSCASSDQLSQGPVEDNALDSYDQKLSHHSASNIRQHPSTSAAQLSESSIGGNSLGSSDHLSSQYSVDNSHNSYSSADQLSQGHVEVNSLESSDRNLSQHVTSSNSDLSAVLLSACAIKDNSPGSSDRVPAQHSVSNSPNCDTSACQLSEGSIEDNSHGSSHRSVSNSQQSFMSVDQRSQGSIDDSSLDSGGHKLSQHSASSNDHSGVSVGRLSQDSIKGSSSQELSQDSRTGSHHSVSLRQSSERSDCSGSRGTRSISSDHSRSFSGSAVYEQSDDDGYVNSTSHNSNSSISLDMPVKGETPGSPANNQETGSLSSKDSQIALERKVCLPLDRESASSEFVSLSQRRKEHQDGKEGNVSTFVNSVTFLSPKSSHHSANSNPRYLQDQASPIRIASHPSPDEENQSVRSSDTWASCDFSDGVSADKQTAQDSPRTSRQRIHLSSPHQEDCSPRSTQSSSSKPWASTSKPLMNDFNEAQSLPSQNLPQETVPSETKSCPSQEFDGSREFSSLGVASSATDDHLVMPVGTTPGDSAMSDKSLCVVTDSIDGGSDGSGSGGETSLNSSAKSLHNVLNASVHDIDRIMSSARNVLDRQMSNLALNNSESSSSEMQPSLVSESSDAGEEDGCAGLHSQGSLVDQAASWGVFESYGVGETFVAAQHNELSTGNENVPQPIENRHTATSNCDGGDSCSAGSRSCRDNDESSSSPELQESISPNSYRHRVVLGSVSKLGSTPEESSLSPEVGSFIDHPSGSTGATPLNKTDVVDDVVGSPSNRTSSEQTFVEYGTYLMDGGFGAIAQTTAKHDQRDESSGHTGNDLSSSSPAIDVDEDDHLTSATEFDHPTQSFESLSTRSKDSVASSTNDQDPSSDSGSHFSDKSQPESSSTIERKLSVSSCHTDVEETNDGHETADVSSEVRGDYGSIDADWFRSADQAMSNILSKMDNATMKEAPDDSNVGALSSDIDLTAVIGCERSDDLNASAFPEELSTLDQELLRGTSNVDSRLQAVEEQPTKAIDTDWFQSADQALATIISKRFDGESTTDPGQNAVDFSFVEDSNYLPGPENEVGSPSTKGVDSEWLRSADEVMANMLSKLEASAGEMKGSPQEIADENNDLYRKEAFEGLRDGKIDNAGQIDGGTVANAVVVDTEWLRSADAVMANMQAKLKDDTEAMPLTSKETPVGTVTVDDDWFRSADEAMGKIAAKLDRTDYELHNHTDSTESTSLRAPMVRRSSVGQSTHRVEPVVEVERASKRSSLVPTKGSCAGENGNNVISSDDTNGFAAERVAMVTMDDDWMAAADAALERLHTKTRQAEEQSNSASTSSADSINNIADPLVNNIPNEHCREYSDPVTGEGSETDFGEASQSEFGASSTHDYSEGNTEMSDVVPSFPPVPQLRRRVSLGGNVDAFQAYKETRVERPDSSRSHTSESPDGTVSSSKSSTESSSEICLSKKSSDRSQSSKREEDVELGTDWFETASAASTNSRKHLSDDTEGLNDGESQSSARSSGSKNHFEQDTDAPIPEGGKVVIDEDWLKKADSLLAEVLGTDVTRDANESQAQRDSHRAKSTDDVAGMREKFIEYKDNSSMGSNLTEDNLWDLDDGTSFVSEGKSQAPLDLSEGNSSVSDELKSIMSNDESLGIINEDEEDTSRASLPKTSYPVRETLREESKTDWKPYDEDSPSENSIQKTRKYSDDDFGSDSSSSSSDTGVNWRLRGWICMGLVLVLVLLLAMPWIVRRDENLDGNDDDDDGFSFFPEPIASPTPPQISTPPPFVVSNTKSPTVSPIMTNLPTQGPILADLISWEQRASFDGERGSQLGSWVSLTNDIAVIGQPLVNAFNTILIDPDGDILSEMGETSNAGIDGFGTVLSSVVNGRLVVSSLSGQVVFFLYSQFLKRWQQVGNELTGDTDGLDENFGSSIAVSDAFRVVVGAPKNPAAGIDTGRVYTFDYQRGIDLGWTQSDPLPLVGENPGELFGSAVAMSDDGTILHVGAPGSKEGGYVRVLLWTGISWEEICQIDSEFGGEGFGSSIETVSSAGDVIVVGAPNHGFDRGALRVYQIERETSACAQIGPDIVGEAGNRLGTFGSAAGLYTGATLSIVASTENGFVERFDLGSDSVWVRNYERLTTASTGKATVAISSLNKQDFVVVGQPELDNVLVFVAPSLHSTTKAPTLRPVPSPIAAPTKSPVPAVLTTPPTPTPLSPKPIVGQWIEAGGPYRIGQSGIGFGDAVALGVDTMATGASLGIGVGVVLTFQRDADGWGAGPSQQLVGKQQGGEFGSAVAFSSDANLLLIGAPGMFGIDGSTPQGAVFCYGTNTEGKWEQRGSMLQGIEGVAGAYEEFGMVLAASGAAGRVVVGAPGSSTVGSAARHGRVYVFEYDDDSQDWLETSTLSGMVADELFGSAVAISGNGNFLIVGSPDVGAGFATIYQHNIFRWFPITTIDGVNLGDKMGRSVEFLAEDGSLVAAGSPSFDNGRGRIVVFQRDDETGRFNQLGPELIGNTGERFGEAKRMGSSGNNPVTISVGTPTGLVKQFQLQADSWTEKLDSLDSGLRTRSGLLALDTFGDNEVVLGGDDLTVLYEVI